MVQLLNILYRLVIALDQDDMPFSDEDVECLRQIEPILGVEPYPWNS